MYLDETHSMNQPLLNNMRRRKQRVTVKPIVSPDMTSDPYMQAGSHPDIVARIWNDLGAVLYEDRQAIVYGSPALVHPEAGIVLAVAYGTSYLIRVPAESIQNALKIGCLIEKEWSDGSRTDVVAEMGPGWVFGCWAEEEKRWLVTMDTSLRTIATGSD